MAPILLIQSPETLQDLADLQRQLRSALGQAKRLRKYSRTSDFTPVEQVVLSNLIAAEQRLRRMRGNLTPAAAQATGTDQAAPDWGTK